MNKIVKIILLFLWITFYAQAQEKSSVNDFIPEGYSEFEKFYGDLNNDGKKDCVLIIKKSDPDNIITNRYGEKADRNRRGIIVLFKGEAGYKIATKNDDCFSSENEDGGVYMPPELWIKIEDKKLFVHYGHGRYGYWEYTFRYHNSDFELIGYHSSANRGPIANEKTSINFLSKKKLIRENINKDAATENDEVYEETWSEIETDTLIKLSEIKDFDQLRIEIQEKY